MKITAKRLTNNVTLNFIPTKKFKTIVINLAFKGEYNPKDVTGLYLLTKLLQDSSKKYPESELISKQLNYLFGADLNISSQLIGKLNLITISATILDPKLVGKKFKLLDKIFSLMNQLIYHPNIKNNLFDQASFERVKLNHFYRLKALENDKETVANIRVKNLVDLDHPYKLLTPGNLKELEALTNHDLVKLYQNVLNREVEMYVLGDLKVDEVNRLIKKYFKAKKVKTTANPIIKINQSKHKSIVEQSKFNQSQLLYLLTTNTLVNQKDYYPMIMFNAIFGRTPLSKLFRIVREKHSLCYSISSSYQVNYGMINVSAGIDAKNYQLADKLIKKQLLEMKQGKFSQEDLELNRKMLITIAEHTFDQPTGLVSYVLSSKILKTEYSKEAYINKLLKVTKQDVIRAAQKVELKIAYLLKQGDNNASK